MFVIQHDGIHQTAYQPAWGEGFEDAFRNVSVAKDDIFLKLGINIGEKFPYQNTIFQAVRAREAIAKGDWVKLKFGGADRLGTVTNATAPTAKAIRSSFNLTADELVNIEKGVPGWLFITSGTGIGQRRRILANTGSTDASPNLITVSEPYYSLIGDTNGIDAFATVPANADGLSLICPWEVVKTAAAYEAPQGVAMGAINDGEYGIIAIAGLALAKCVGSGEALVAGKPIVISGTAGVAKGQIAVPGSATAAMNEAREVGWAVDAYNGATALRHVWLSGAYAL